MKKEEKYLGKGIYSHPQINGYLSVKQFMIVKREDKKILLLRFANESDMTVNSAQFILKQLDSSAKVIKSSKFKYSNINVSAEQMYTPDSGIVLERECVDFVIQLIWLVSDKYKYRFKNGKVSVHYDIRGYKEGGVSASESEGNYVFAERKRWDYPKPCRVSAFISVVIMIISLVTSAYLGVIKSKGDSVDEEHESSDVSLPQDEEIE